MMESDDDVHYTAHCCSCCHGFGFLEIFLVIGRTVAGLALGMYNEFYKHVNNIHTVSVRGVSIIGSTKYQLSICFLPYQ